MRLIAAPGGEHWRLRWQELIRSIVRVHGADGERQLLDWLQKAQEPVVLAFANAHAMNSCVADRRFFEALMSADVVVRDGVGVALLMTLLNQRAGLNLNGTDFIPKLIGHFAGGPIALFGTQDPWLGRARQAVSRRLAPGSACIVAHGFHDVAVYARLAATHRPRLIVLGMGMPRQEEVAVVLRAALGYPCVIVCGGAILDFLGQRVPRAPRWMRSSGLEWAWRLYQEPRRLFERYVLGNPVFVARSVRLAVDEMREQPSPAHEQVPLRVPPRH